MRVHCSPTVLDTQMPTQAPKNFPQRDSIRTNQVSAPISQSLWGFSSLVFTAWTWTTRDRGATTLRRAKAVRPARRAADMVASCVGFLGSRNLSRECRPKKPGAQVDLRKSVRRNPKTDLKWQNATLPFASCPAARSGQNIVNSPDIPGLPNALVQFQVKNKPTSHSSVLTYLLSSSVLDRTNHCHLPRLFIQILIPRSLHLYRSLEMQRVKKYDTYL